MNQPHLIRLRGPWQRSILAGAARPTTTVTMPGSWEQDLGREFHGRVEYQRFFNRPTGIDDTTMLRLTFVEVVGRATVFLNDSELGRISFDHRTLSSFDVSGRLTQRNRLRVQVDALPANASPIEEDDENVPAAGGLVGEVRLEIG